MNASIEEEIAEKSTTFLTELLQQTKIIFLSTSVAYEKDMNVCIEPQARNTKNYNYHYFNGKIKSEAYITRCQNYCIVRPGSIYGTTPYGELIYDNEYLKSIFPRFACKIASENFLLSISMFLFFQHIIML